jgi:hypothetical protein
MNLTCHLKQKSLFFLSIFISITAFAQKSEPRSGIESITSSKIKAHVDYLASDALMGRNSPSPGLDSAAAYITKEFIKYGLQQVNGSYYNPVPLVIRSLGEGNFVEVNNNGETISLKIKTGFVPFESSASGEVSGSLVFAGYGITAPEYNYDDYAGLDVKGKIVVVLRHEPGEEDTASIFKGKENTKYATNETKAEIALAHGAVGMLIITDPLNHQLLAPRGFPWPSLSKIIPKDALPITLEDKGTKKLPLVHVGKEITDLLFGSTDSLKSIQIAIDKSLKPFSKEFPSIVVKMKVTINEDHLKTGNIVGLIPGTDPVLKNEYLIIGGHYDHVGFNKTHAEGEDYIINGADDNASGTAGVLTIAEAFTKMREKPKRSVLFMAFTAEERGLYGSTSYVQNPLFPLEKTVAMFNLDMIGRNSMDSAYLEGASVSPDLVDIVKNQNKGIGFTLVPDDELFERSDNAPFYKKKVPFISCSSGLHADYHTVRDNPDTINPAKAAKISRLIFKTAWFVANDNKYYQLKELKK